MIAKGGFTHVVFALIKRITIECLHKYKYYYGIGRDNDIKDIKTLLYDGVEKIVFYSEKNLQKNNANTGRFRKMIKLKY